MAKKDLTNPRNILNPTYEELVDKRVRLTTSTKTRDGRNARRGRVGTIRRVSTGTAIVLDLLSTDKVLMIIDVKGKAHIAKIAVRIT